MERTVEGVFRSSSTTLVASLTRAIGPSHLDLVENIVQEAFLRAMNEWRTEVPANPAGWLLTVARNMALDQLRRDRSFETKQDAIGDFIEMRAASLEPSASLKSELADDQLAMILVACHPCNSVPSQIVLALRTLCGLEIPTIARALQSSTEAIEKRLVLARRRIREENVSFDLPSAENLGPRLDGVLRVLYLLLNEAYWATSSPDIVHQDVALEAIRLASFLADHPATARPRVFALVALMHFHASRFPARIDAEGNLVALPDQDRTLWKKNDIESGMAFLALSAQGEEASSYHYEAAIAAIHAMSPDIASTDWTRIVRFYDELVAGQSSTSARLSRAIAIGHRDGPDRALEELATLADDDVLLGLAPFHAAEAHAHERRGDPASARAAFERARELSTNEHERRWLDARISRL